MLVANAAVMSLLLPVSRQFIQEPATPRTFDVLLGIALDTHGLIELIRSADPRYCGQAGEIAGLVVQCEENGMRALFEGGVLELRFKGPVELGGAALPADLFTVEIPDGWSRLELDDAAGRVLLQ